LQIANNDGSSYRFGYGGSSDVYLDADKVYIRSDNGGANRYTFTPTGLGIGITTPQTTLQVDGAASALNAHFGQGQNNSSGIFGGISLGYAENTNAAYRKVAIVAQAKGDGAARQDLQFLVDSNY